MLFLSHQIMMRCEAWAQPPGSRPAAKAPTVSPAALDVELDAPEVAVILSRPEEERRAPAFFSLESLEAVRGCKRHSGSHARRIIGSVN